VRIAVATQYLYRVGGVETYLECVLPALTARGHEVRVWHEFPSVPDVERIVPAAIPSCQIGPGIEGADRARQDLTGGVPDVIFLHGLSDPALEERLGALAPLVTFLHTYHGTCISGTKTHSFPTPRVCSRALGPGCLLRYYPQRCGGWSPVTMVTSYARQRRRQALLRSSGFVTTFSEHMRRECLTQGIDAARVIRLPAFTPSDLEVAHDTPRPSPIDDAPAARQPDTRKHLLFVGRMEKLKGGEVFIDAIDRLDPALRRHLRVTFAGDGRERARWEQQAARVSRGEVEIRFVGWRSRADLYDGVDLLVVPSLWPEPLGLVGLEAAAAGVPAVGFDVGGIREWLVDGVTGRLVPAAPASSTALAAALEECLNAPAMMASWAKNARAESCRRTLAAHVLALEDVFNRVVPGSFERRVARKHEM